MHAVQGHTGFALGSIENKQGLCEIGIAVKRGSDDP